MAQVLGFAADALWILALAIMAAASRQAWARVPADAAVPVATGPDGQAIMTTTRGRALLAVLVLAFVVGILLSLGRIWADRHLLAALVLFLARATLAAAFALAHLRWLRMVLERVERRSALKA